MRALTLVAVVLGTGCAPSVCGTVTALSDTVSVDTLVERCGAALDTRGVSWDDGLRELVFGWSDPSGASTPLAPTASLFFLEDAGPSWAFSHLLATATVTTSAGLVTSVPLTAATLAQESDTRWRWNLLFEGSGTRVTLDGDDEVAFSAGAPADEPLARPARDDGGVDGGLHADGGADGGVDAGLTACGLEFGLPPTPQAGRAPTLTLISREPAADPLCTQGLAYLALVDLSSSTLGRLVTVEAALPGRALVATDFAGDSATATVLICAPTSQPRLFLRVGDGALSADLCGDTRSLAQTACPFATSLPSPSAGFTPPFTHTSPTSVALCARGLAASFSFSTDVRVSGYALEQPFGRTQQSGVIGSGSSWQFDSCLTPPDLGVFAVQLLTSTGLRSDVHCEQL
jgi:hypothetical protein